VVSKLTQRWRRLHPGFQVIQDLAHNSTGRLCRAPPAAGVADSKLTVTREVRLRPMGGLKRHRSARILAAGHAFAQNFHRGHHDIATDVSDRHRLRIAFDDLAITL
jgi:hypothetical protein